MGNNQLNRPSRMGAKPAKPESINDIPKRDGRAVKLDKIARRAEDHIEPENPKEAVLRGQGQGARGLTAKQEAFACLVAQGSTLSDAYRTAYNAEGMSPSTVWSSASVLADVPKVAARINQEVERIERERPHDDAASRRLVREYLVSVVTDKQAKTSDRTRAAELLGKVAGVGLFSSKEEKPSDKPTNQTEFEALLDRLKTLLPEEAVEDEEETGFGDGTES
jgi:hypothetical protein